MPRGDKSAYTDKRSGPPSIEEDTKRKPVKSRARAGPVNRQTGGGNKSGSGRGVPDTTVSARKGGRLGGAASAARPAAARSASAKKAARTRKARAGK